MRPKVKDAADAPTIHSDVLYFSNQDHPIPNRVMKSLRLSAALLFCATATAAFGQISYREAGSTYRQDFNHPRLAQGHTEIPWRDNETFPGWFAAYFDGIRGVYTTPDIVMATSGRGQNSIAFYLYRSEFNRADGALGAQPSDERAPGLNRGGMYYGVALTNDTGVTLNRLRLSYRVELWRLTATPTRQETLHVAYQVGGTGLDEGFWRTVPGSHYTTPHQGDGPGSTARNLDGNTPENVVEFNNLEVTGLNLVPGQTIWLRWFDVNNPSFDHGVGIDDVEIVLNP